MKVAIIHYWLINWRGGEKVVENLLELFPEADIYTHVYNEELTEGKLKGRIIYTTFINKLPRAEKYYQKYLPLMPIALEQLDLRKYDLVFSSESGPSKGIITRPDAMHICYCHSPMRYVWDMYPDYIKTTGWFTRLVMRPLIHYLKIWDRLSADRVDYFIANSSFVAKRIKKFYRRDSEVIHPPVDVSEFSVSTKISDYYLVLGQLTPYKKADLVVDAFLANGKKLIVLGDGEQYEGLKMKENENIKILGRASWDDCKLYLCQAKALIFPGVEDFGMVPVEAMASGRPVIAYNKGGALETIVEGLTGIFFNEQTTESLNDAIMRFESNENIYISENIRRHANQFNTDKFKQRIKSFIDNLSGQ